MAMQLAGPSSQRRCAASSTCRARQTPLTAPVCRALRRTHPITLATTTTTATNTRHLIQSVRGITPLPRPRSRNAVGGCSGGRQRLLTAAPTPLRPNRGRRGGAILVSANLFTRVYRIVTSFFNGLVSSFEDPERLLDRLAEEMQEDLTRMRQATAQVMASQRQLTVKQKNMQAGADQWLSRAELAVSRGQDDLAREALRRRKVLQEDADRMGEQVTLQTQALEQLQANMRMLEGKMGEARGKKETLKARAASARTSLALQEMIGGLQMRTGTSWAAFEQMEEKVAALEAQAQSATALAAPDSLERQFAALEGDVGVEGQLAALKEQRGKERRGPPPSLPPPVSPPSSHLTGVPLRDVFDPLERELEELRRRARE